MRKPSSTRKVFAASRAGVGAMPGSLPRTALGGATMPGACSAATLMGAGADVRRLAKIKVRAVLSRRLRGDGTTCGGLISGKPVTLGDGRCPSLSHSILAMRGAEPEQEVWFQGRNK